MAKRVLPVQQLTILALCRFAEPLSLLSVLPYLPEMIENFGVATNEIALWAGIAASLYSASECIMAIPWGMLSDHLGRRPVILLSLTITMVTSLVWGFSTSLPMALTARVLAGAGNGVAGIIRTMVAEICPWKELQPVAFSIMPVVYNLGSILGPVVGGALANPYHRTPGTPAGPRLFEKYPYALPNIATACFFLLGIVIGILFLHETLLGRKDRKDIGLVLGEKMVSKVRGAVGRLRYYSLGSKEAETERLIDSSTNSDTESLLQCESENGIRTGSHADPKSRPTWKDVLSKQSCLNLAAYGLLCMHSLSYDQLLPVYMHHPVQTLNSPDVHLPFKFSSGFGIDTSRISLLFTFYGIANMFFQFFIFPSCVRRFGTLRCFKICCLVFPITYFITPFASLLPTPKTQQSALLFIWMIKGLCSNIGFPSSTILLVNSVSISRHLARLNGVSVVVSSIGRAVGPSIMGPMFTFGVERGYVGLPFWTLAAITSCGAVPVFYLADPDEMKIGTEDE
ncbi:MFS transporter [Acephala macrosclerotiorum]|nr:MFS transporter [Acephala macrosclerotiorum]